MKKILKRYISKIISNFFYMFKKNKILKIQKKLLQQKYRKEENKVVIFLVPGRVKINGGVMSICNIAKVSKEILSKFTVVIATLPKEQTFNRYTEFDSEFDIFNFKMLIEYFSNLEELIIHVPEYSLGNIFFNNLSEKEKKKLKNIPKLKINILNQNILLMPPKEDVEKLKVLTSDITMTIAHRKYCTQELMNNYKIPIHFLSAEYTNKYEAKKYKDKENIILYSPDFNKDKKRILKKLKKELKLYTFIEIRNMKYKEYRELIAKAKYMITFGEGLDSYFIETFRSGGIAFAVYNEDFFLDKYKEIDTLLDSYEKLENNIVKIINDYDNEISYNELSNKAQQIISKEYNYEEYKENIKKYYEKKYTFNKV